MLTQWDKHLLSESLKTLLHFIDGFLYSHSLYHTVCELSLPLHNACDAYFRLVYSHGASERGIRAPSCSNHNVPRLLSPLWRSGDLDKSWEQKVDRVWAENPDSCGICILHYTHSEHIWEQFRKVLKPYSVLVILFKNAHEENIFVKDILNATCICGK